MLRLTETEIRDTLNYCLASHNIRVGTMNKIIDDLQAIEAARAKPMPKGVQLKVCRYLEDGRSATLAVISTIRSVLPE